MQEIGSPAKTLTASDSGIEEGSAGERALCCRLNVANSNHGELVKKKRHTLFERKVVICLGNLIGRAVLDAFLVGVLLRLQPLPYSAAVLAEVEHVKNT